jgi:hypothetical protein
MLSANAAATLSAKLKSARAVPLGSRDLGASPRLSQITELARHSRAGVMVTGALPPDRLETGVNTLLVSIITARQPRVEVSTAFVVESAKAQPPRQNADVRLPKPPSAKNPTTAPRIIKNKAVLAPAADRAKTAKDAKTAIVERGKSLRRGLQTLVIPRETDA